jgi:hypothetical protein
MLESTERYEIPPSLVISLLSSPLCNNMLSKSIRKFIFQEPLRCSPDLISHIVHDWLLTTDILLIPKKVDCLVVTLQRIGTT